MRPVAIVTGASRGIGRAIATDLVSSHTVIGTYKGNKEAAESLAQATGCPVIQCDVASRADHQHLVAEVLNQYGRIDLLVNNAGIAPRVRADLLEASEEIFDEVLGTNLKGPHFLTQLVAQCMLKQKSGRIVFITSISAYTASVNRGEYCISKAGLSMSAALWAQRLASEQIGVFEIRPGIIRTDMISAVESIYQDKITNGLVPQRRMGEGEDVAKAVRAIADGHLDYSTGQVIDVDGGFRLRSL